MQFISNDTIAALATAPGEGGIAVIRISGKEALLIASKVFSGPVASYLSHTAHLGVIRTLEGKRLDEVLLLVMRSPRSFTGEDIVELQCHGGMVVTKKILEAVFAAGARPAEAGEFTFRAFMNGKLDLMQAEAIQALISAKSEQAFEVAKEHLAGSLSEKVRTFQKELIRIAAILEAWVDFPEEDLLFASEEEIVVALQKIAEEMQHLLLTFDDGRKLSCGISLCIVGPPNAGKSSLMNALLDHERAIVTPLAGTTRDLLHEELILGGLHFRLTDTAGIRETDEAVEQEGIRRSKKALQSADLVLLVLDQTQPHREEEEMLLESVMPHKTLLVWNKADLGSAVNSSLSFPFQVHISAKKKMGLEELKEKIHAILWKNGAPPKDQVVITTLRHKEALSQALENLHAVIIGLNRAISPELLTADLRMSLVELGRMIGSDITEDILSSIFSQFCIGK